MVKVTHGNSSAYLSVPVFGLREIARNCSPLLVERCTLGAIPRQRIESMRLRYPRLFVTSAGMETWDECRTPRQCVSIRNELFYPPTRAVSSWHRVRPVVLIDGNSTIVVAMLRRVGAAYYVLMVVDGEKVGVWFGGWRSSAAPKTLYIAARFQRPRPRKSMYFYAMG